MTKQKDSDYPHAGLLLLGPTGSGKTPLGDYLEKKGLWKKRCHHFDFGKNLRRIHSHMDEAVNYSDKERAVVLLSLTKGHLLENDEFFLAEKIFHRFLADRYVAKDNLIVLNGIPRHIGQARAIAHLVNVFFICILDASLQVIAERIRRNSDGEREGRKDDSPALIRKKIGIYQERTEPLLDYYKKQHIPILKIKVSPSAKAEQHYRILEKTSPFAE